MNFMEAVKAMKERKKVRRPHWNNGVYWQNKYDCIDCNKKDCPPSLNFTNFEATDWEIYKEEDKELINKSYYGVSPKEIFDDSIIKLMNAPVIDKELEFKDEVKVFGEVCQNILKKKKKDNWNLADKKQDVKNMVLYSGVIYEEEHIKTFIQKVKEDICKIRDNCVDVKQQYIYNLAYNDFQEIIDKRAGELKWINLK